MRVLAWTSIVWLCGCALPHPIERLDPAPALEPGSAVTSPISKPTWNQIGSSVNGQPIRAITLGHGTRTVLWIGGIHGNEREGSVATQQLPAAFMSRLDAPELVSLTIIEDINPDGSARGMRGNANRVDLNRNYPASNFRSSRGHGRRPLSQPEARFLHDLILELDPDLVIVAHSWRGAHFINFDGPAERLARLFLELSGYPMKRSADIAPTPGSLGSWVGRTLGIPILTLEYRKGKDPDEAWEETRAAILSVIVGT